MFCWIEPPEQPFRHGYPQDEIDALPRRELAVGEDAAGPATVEAYSTNCSAGGHAELWTVTGGPHIPTLTATFQQQLIDYLLAHPKP